MHSKNETVDGQLRDDTPIRKDEMSSYRKRLDAILDTTADGIITIDVRGRIENFNKACERIFGYKAEEVIGANIKMLMPSSYADEHDTYIHNYLNTGERKVIGSGREVEAQRKDGSIFPIDLSIGEYEIDGERFFSGIVRDITARKRAEEQLLRSNIELERFAYIASHDLQEPMRMVSSFSELLEKEYAEQLDDTARQYIAFISDGANRMQALVHDLLEYSRAGRDDIDMQLINTQERLQVVLQDMNEVISESGAEVIVDELPFIVANPMHFVRLMQNLISNAIKYKKSDAPPKIHIGAEKKDNVWVFHVHDNGIGIKQSYLNQVFVIFKRLHKRSEYEGTGIGLSICKRVVESMGGKIWVVSEEGEGSTFYFTVPVNENSSGERA